jgi:hypothetical protein
MDSESITLDKSVTADKVADFEVTDRQTEGATTTVNIQRIRRRLIKLTIDSYSNFSL